MTDKLLTLDQCAERIGNKTSTWRAWIMKRKVTYYKVGRSIRVLESDLLKIIEEAKVPAIEQNKLKPASDRPKPTHFKKGNRGRFSKSPGQR